MNYQNDLPGLNSVVVGREAVPTLDRVEDPVWGDARDFPLARVLVLVTLRFRNDQDSGRKQLFVIYYDSDRNCRSKFLSQICVLAN